MSHVNEKTRSAVTRLAAVVMVAVALLLTGTAQAAVPGITASAGGSSTFNLVANQGYISQPDGAQIYSWGYGCATSSATFVPYTTAAFCPTMQVPGPTMVVTQGTTVTVTLTNNLPKGAGNTSIVFQGATVTVVGTPSGGTGLLAAEAAPGGSVTYSVTYANAGTHAFYSGTQSDLQIEMGMYGAVVVLPSATPSGANCSSLHNDIGQELGIGNPGNEFRLAVAAYNHPEACYDREYLTQWMELDAHIHKQAENQVQAIANCTAAVGCPTALDVKTEPYHPSYFMINGRSMPDNMDPSYAPNYPNQPYNANPHMHPGDMVLIRVVGQGHWQHPFHEHGNHVRILARDGNLILSQNDTVSPPRLGGRMEFNTDTTPGQAFDGIFYWSGKGLGWDIYGHSTLYAAATQPCYPDANGYYTKNSSPAAGATTPNYYEWCADHNHPLETNPVGEMAKGGPATQFDPLVATNGLWYNGTPYLGPDAVGRNRGNTPLPVGSASQNPFAESGIAFMWHSHNEREITTNDVFPGGMLQMMLVDPPVWYIDETL